MPLERLSSASTPQGWGRYQGAARGAGLEPLVVEEFQRRYAPAAWHRPDRGTLSRSPQAMPPQRVTRAGARDRRRRAGHKPLRHPG